VLIFILLAAAVVVAGLQEWIEFGLILGVITINVLIGMIQEGKAEKAAEAIKAMLSASGIFCNICYNMYYKLPKGPVQSLQKYIQAFKKLEVLHVFLLHACLLCKPLHCSKGSLTSISLLPF
jgi:magnesium-transporting ATPase (P-type)